MLSNDVVIEMIKIIVHIRISIGYLKLSVLFMLVDPIVNSPFSLA